MASSKKRKKHSKKVTSNIPLTKYNNNPIVKAEIQRAKKFYNDFLLNSVDELIDVCEEICTNIENNDFYDFYNDGRTYEQVSEEVGQLVLGRISNTIKHRKKERDVRIALISSVLMGAKLNGAGRIDYMPAIIFEKVMRPRFSEITNLEFALRNFRVAMDSGCMKTIILDICNKMHKLQNLFATLLFDSIYDRVDKYLDEVNFYKDIEEMFEKFSTIIGSTQKQRIVDYMIANECGENTIKEMETYIDSIERIKPLELDMEDIEENILEQKAPKNYTHRNYKELNAMAINNGYDLIRNHGDHGIFSNKNGEIILIPQGRDIGKGLQIQIVKKLSL